MGQAIVTSIIGGMEKSDYTGIFFPVVYLSALLDHNFINLEELNLGYIDGADVEMHVWAVLENECEVDWK